MLRTRFMSQGYVSPELLGLLPRTGVANTTYTNEIDIWALGCIVHEMLTGEIPFLDRTQYPESESLLDSDLDEVEMLQIDVTALKEFCDGTAGFPTDSMRRSKVSDAAELCVKSMLVVIPQARVTAHDALQSAWLLETEGPRVVTESIGEQQRKKNHMCVSSCSCHGSLLICWFYSR